MAQRVLTPSRRPLLALSFLISRRPGRHQEIAELAQYATTPYTRGCVLVKQKIKGPVTQPSLCSASVEGISVDISSALAPQTFRSSRLNLPGPLLLRRLPR